MLTLQVAVQDPDNFQALPVEDVAEILLDHLRRTTPHSANLRNLCMTDGSPVSAATFGKASAEFDNQTKLRPFKDRLEQLRNKILWPLAEAWNFLERHGLIAQEPMTVEGFYFVTRAGLAIQNREDFDKAIGQAVEPKSKKRASA